MILYRIISEHEWDETKLHGIVPRCTSDERDDCVHLTKFEDITVVAQKYFERHENPVVLEIDVSNFESKILWREPTNEKPWQQPNADIKNISWENINRYSYLIPQIEKGNEYIIGTFLALKS